ncbi:hypothetical protein ACQ7HM_05850 [Williamsia sp. MIQD14]|uniref:hypothetical protein n=1 Tax=Williamsia sp. MIQD14 TaxID=3425703 RepID=UPI003DA181B5
MTDGPDHRPDDQPHHPDPSARPPVDPDTDPFARQPGPGPADAPPPRVTPPEPPWFTAADPGPPRGSPEAPPWVPMSTDPSSNWSETLEQIAVRGRRRSRGGNRRRVALIAGAVVVVAGIAAGAIVFATSSGSSGSGTTVSGAGSGANATVPAQDGAAPADGPQIPFCTTGTDGAVTTIDQRADPTSPTGAVATFLAAAITDRSPVAARAAIADTAPVPTVIELQRWISALPQGTDAWCARVTLTDSAARVLVDVRVRTPVAVADVARGDAFYVSSDGADRWTIDAIVSDDAS